MPGAPQQAGCLCTAERLLQRVSSPDCRLFMSKSLAHRLAEYACSLNYEDLAPEVVHEVKRRVIDSFGCALGAWDAEPC
ncbi:MAG: MmgE/PrpD family protein, partial [Chthoniobacterales bacterium]